MAITTSEIRVLTSGLLPGGQLSGELCPFCKGGTSKERAFSVRKNEDHSITYKCHRAKCQCSGNLPPSAGSVTTYGGATAPVPQKQEFYGPLTSIPDEAMEKLVKKYSLTKEDVRRGGFSWAPQLDGGRLAMPIRNRWIRSVGFSFRTLDKRKTPKNRIYMSDPVAPAMSFYPAVQEGSAVTMYQPKLPVVIMEDQISAIRASKFVNTVALLGTYLGAAKVLELIKVKPQEVIIALDEDASSLAAEYVLKYRDFFPKLRMVQLKYDLKEIADEAIQEILEPA
jgi:hypothetical protein